MNHVTKKSSQAFSLVSCYLERDAWISFTISWDITALSWSGTETRSENKDSSSGPSKVLLKKDNTKLFIRSTRVSLSDPADWKKLLWLSTLYCLFHLLPRHFFMIETNVDILYQMSVAIFFYVGENRIPMRRSETRNFGFFFVSSSLIKQVVSYFK